MNVTEAMQRRRAVRSYLPQPLEESMVRSLLKAAVWAPSAMNAQPWRFAVVQNRQVLKRYSDTAKRMLADRVTGDHKVAKYGLLLATDSYNVFYDAPTLVVIGADVRTPYGDADAWLAAGHLMLAATEVGLGTCPIGLALPALNSPEIRKELGLGIALAAIVVGYAVVSRQEPVVTRWVRA